MEEEIGIKFIATVTGMKGSCHACHQVGQKFQLNCYDSGGLCGFFIMIPFPTSMRCSLAGNIHGGIRTR